MVNSLQSLKHEIREMPNRLIPHDGFKPVIVKTEYEVGKFCFGVQFWRELEIHEGKSRNSDGTLARLIELVE